MTCMLSGSAKKPILFPQTAAVVRGRLPHSSATAVYERPPQSKPSPAGNWNGSSMRCRRRRRLLSPPVTDIVKLIAFCAAAYFICVYVLKLRPFPFNSLHRVDQTVPSSLLRQPTLQYLPNAQNNNSSAAKVAPLEKKTVIKPIEDTDEKSGPIVLLVFAANRPAAIKNHLTQLLSLRPSESQFPVVVSQDCCHEDTKNTILTFKDRVTFIEHPDQRKQPGFKGAKNYFLISQHYRWALDHVFMTLGYQHAIITEDDLDISDDFFAYFLALRRLLKEDETVWCISAWNDNGADSLTDRKHSEYLHRTDFFPGLGWMLQRSLWLELRESWPTAFWDDWLREQKVRKGRSCVRPEVSRTAHNMLVAGKGSSNGMYKNYLSSIHLPEEEIDFAKIDVSYLLKDNYDRLLKSALESARPMSLTDVKRKSSMVPGISVRFPYETPRQFRELAVHFGLMKDIRSGMARTAYNGIVTFYFNDARAYLYPAIDPFAYNETWDGMTRYLEFAELFCRPGRYTGKCDPKEPAMIAWFAKMKQSKRLEEWTNLIVN